MNSVSCLIILITFCELLEFWSVLRKIPNLQVRQYNMLPDVELETWKQSKYEHTEIVIKKHNFKLF